MPLIDMVKHLRVTFRPDIGSGAFGTVYKAKDTKTKNTVAVKEVKLRQNASRNQELVDMARQEIRMIRGLQSHKNIVRVIDSFEHDNSFWIVMEFCDLGDLKKYLEDNEDISRYHQVEIMLQSSSAIAFMHAQNPPVVHRDVKLQNILMKTEGSKKIAKVCDFGFARFHDDKSGTSYSAAFKQKPPLESLRGTAPFMAPEFSLELNSGLQYDRHVDTFALGLVYQVILEPEFPDLCPRSVGMKKANTWSNIGYEMVRCHKKEEDMPLVVETLRSDDRLTKNLKKIITNMTKFKSDDRKRIHEVEEELEEILELLKDDNGDKKDASAGDKKGASAGDKKDASAGDNKDASADFREQCLEVQRSSIVMVKHLKVTCDPLLGSSAFAIVYEAYDTKTKKTVAVKRTKGNDEFERIARRELQMILQLQNHNNIIRAIEGFEHSNSFWLVLELCDHGDLHKYMTDNKEISRYHQVEIMLQSSSAVAFMHAQNPLVAHRHIKPGHILIKKEGPQKIVKLCDFGHAHVMKNPSALYKMTRPIGSSPYNAPEFSLEDETGFSYDHHVDTFSLGLVFQVILEPNWPHLYPLSVGARKAKQEVNIGYEMVHCYRNKLPMPLVVETQTSDDRVTRRLKRIITQMTKFKSTERKYMQDVEEELGEILEWL